MVRCGVRPRLDERPRAAYLSSADLAREKGAFPFDADKFAGNMMQMDDDVLTQFVNTASATR
jgi:hypothetical protein